MIFSPNFGLHQIRFFSAGEEGDLELVSVQRVAGERELCQDTQAQRDFGGRETRFQLRQPIHAQMGGTAALQTAPEMSEIAPLERGVLDILAG